MGEHPLDPNDKFWEEMEDVLFICIRKDKTINLKTSVTNMEDLKSVLATAYLMAIFQDVKSFPDGVDNMH